jgi:hypothetical protein
MVTKVGHARPMLICTDCGLPLDQRETSAMARQRLWGALTLVAMALVSVAMLLLATSYEGRRAGSVEGSLEQTDDASTEEAKQQKEEILMAPSNLLKPPGGRSGPGPGEPARASGPAAPPAAQQQEEQPRSRQHQP